MGTPTARNVAPAGSEYAETVRSNHCNPPSFRIRDSHRTNGFLQTIPTSGEEQNELTLQGCINLDRVGKVGRKGEKEVTCWNSCRIVSSFRCCGGATNNRAGREDDQFERVPLESSRLRR
ncbi:hypothetical protein TNCV_4948231 [Trichonephila clavipes]|nr:hypothetical protein TNCV_4948231 [Trichonephila clavipes]